MIYLGVVGSRERNSDADKQALKSALEAYLWGKNVKHFTFVSGGCYRGADQFIKQLCKELVPHMQHEFPLIEILPNLPSNTSVYEKTVYGKFVQAYYDRNFKIAAVADYLFALVKNKNDIFDGGTGNTCMQFIDLKGREKLILV